MESSHTSQAQSRRAAIAQAREDMTSAKLPHGARCVYWRLTYHLNPSRTLPEAWPGYRDLREAIGCQNESLSGWLNILKAKQWLTFEDKGKRHVRRYILNGSDGKPLWGVCSGNPEQTESKPSALENQNASALENRSICSGNPEPNPLLEPSLKEPSLRGSKNGFASPSLDEILSFAEEQGQTREQAEAYHDSREAKAWKGVKNWKPDFNGFCRRWAANEKPNIHNPGKPKIKIIGQDEKGTYLLGPDRNAGTTNAGRASLYAGIGKTPGRNGGTTQGHRTK